MFGSPYFYHSTMRNYIIMFGNYFNDIVVQRTNTAGTRLQTISVPISYGPKEKFIVRLAQDPDVDRKIAISLPRLGFEITGMYYDGSRMLSKTQQNKHIVTTDYNNVRTQFTPSPFNFNISLNIFVRNADDGTQIVEQILPYFTPEWTSSVKIVPEMSIALDVPTVLQNVIIEDAYEGDFQTRRAMIWTMDFLVKGWLFGPVHDGGRGGAGVIKRAQVDFHLGSNNSPWGASQILAASARGERVVVTPGLLANGSPTTNSSASIPYSQISANDTFGFAQDIYHYDDGLSYDPSSGTDAP